MNVFIILVLLGVGIVVLFWGYSKTYTDDYRIVKELDPGMNNNINKYYRYKIQRGYSTVFKGKHQWADVTANYFTVYGDSELTIHFGKIAEARGYIEMLKNPINPEVVEVAR